MSIRNKLLVTPILTIIIVSLLVVVSIKTIDIQVNSIDKIYNLRVKTLERVSKVNTIISNMHANLGNTIISTVIGVEDRLLKEKFKNIKTDLNKINFEIGVIITKDLEKSDFLHKILNYLIFLIHY